MRARKCAGFRFSVLAVAGVLLLSLTGSTMAQSAAVNQLYVSAAQAPTNIATVHTYALPPQGFNPVTASAEDLATYGFPQRPDRQTAAQHYAAWERAMLAARNRWNGDLKPVNASSKMRLAAKPATEAAAPATGPTQVWTYNWSGVAATNKLKKWNSAASFYDVYSVFSVPTTQPPFGAECAGGLENTWVGIDGYTAALLDEGTFPLQGGAYSTTQCSSADAYYAVFVSWAAGYQTFLTAPGDIMYVEVSNSLGGFNPGYVFVEDLTTLTYNSYSLDNETGVPLVGNSAEWVVERPNSSTLPNTISIFFDGGAALALNGKTYYPGSSSAATSVITMVDDGDTQNIEIVNQGAGAGYEGEHALAFQTVGCAYAGGCVP